MMINKEKFSRSNFSNPFFGAASLRGINPKKDKRGISELVATILLVLLTVGAVFILAGVIIPFIKNSLGESTSCIKVFKEIGIEKNSCYTDDNTTIVIKAGNVKRVK